ncbi:MAG TPA: TonB-dependent receptor [Puia sp.]|nr:TonB-dependent receptor [Puia sp.]
MRNCLPKAKVLALLSLCLVFSYALMAQQTAVHGRVTSKDRDSVLSNVTVQVRGANRAVQTDDNGAFTIEVDPKATLVFSRIGFETQTVPLNGRHSLNVVLVASNQQMTDVVVVGYGTQKRIDVTGAVSSVPKSRLSELPVTNLFQAVEGSVPGVSVSNTSSVPGATPGVLVRGQNSIAANTGPYIVVDGFPLTGTNGSINDINPNDIASVEILKDASATAIYGTNGSNGVILITTKRGISGKPAIRLSTYTGLDKVAHFLEPRDGPSYVQKYKDFMTETKQVQTGPVPNASELPNYNAGKTTDWMKQVTQQGVTTDNNLSLSGGSKDVRYFISGEYMKQKGAVKGYQYHRAGVRANLDINVTDFLTVGTSAYYSYNNYDGGQANLLFATAMSPYGVEYNADGTYNIYPMYPELLYTNPLLGLYTTNVNHTSTFDGNGYAEIKFSGILKGLKYRFNGGSSFVPAAIQTYTGRDANNLLGQATTYNSETNHYLLENILTYTRDFGAHHIDFTGLYSAEQRKYFVDAFTATGFVNDLLTYNNIGAAATLTPSSVYQSNDVTPPPGNTNVGNKGSYQSKYNKVSQMARINYSYNDRYLLTLTARRDGSSVFGANTTKYGLFPSAAIGWNISQETFMKSVNFVTNLKLRGSYGKTGNQAIDPYGTITTDNSVQNTMNGLTTIGVIGGNLGNADLHWESTTQANIGLDFGIVQNRIVGNIDVYHSNTSGLILKRQIPGITGYTNILDNIGKTTNQGIEVTLTTRNIEMKDFKWETMINYSANKNKIVDLYGDRKSDTGNVWFVGHPIGVIYDYVRQGVWQQGEDPSKQDPTALPGDLKFADINHDGKVTAADKTILGQTAPKWTAGMTNTFAYKNFHLSVFIQTVQGIIKNDGDLNYVDETGRRNTPAAVGYWTPDNKSTYWPALSYFNTRGYGYARNASYTRLKDVTISYTFPEKALEKAHLGGLTIYATGSNLYTWTKWIGWDPENNYATRGSSTWASNYPEVRSIIFGLNLSLR